MDEKLESEIFEKQLNSLYKPLKQTQNTNESGNKTNQGLANQGLEQLGTTEPKRTRS
ncbi:hypothetical protein ID0561_06960 [Helicobacter pylori]